MTLPLLAARLRALRETHWSGRRLTQKELAKALGGSRPLSVPLISSWESTDKPVTPGEKHLEAYARLFCTERSIQGTTLRLLDERHLTADERARRDELLADLNDLRTVSTPAAPPPRGAGFRIPLAAPRDEIGLGPWFFPDQRPITIVCAKLPDDVLGKKPYTDPAAPDFVKLYTYSDLDSLVELHGHIRAVNPACRVNIRAVSPSRRPHELAADDLTAHLVLLGGVDWNVLTRDVSRAVYMPVRQKSRDTEGDYDAFFEVDDGGGGYREHRPRVDRDGEQVTLREDVCHFYRGRNPFNVRRTVTICNGMFGRGTYGAVRALTDARFRDRNEAYIKERFGASATFSILSRVVVVEGEAMTPDWNIAENVLHEWADDGR